MKRTEFLVVAEEMLAEVRESLIGKGEAYSGEADAFANFKANGARLGLSKYQIHMVYMNKHFDAINGAVRANPDHPVEKTEGMPGRILDAIAYLLLLHGMTVEDQRK